MVFEAEKIDPDDPDAMKRMRDMIGPQHIDQLVRQAIQFCWMALPPDKQKVDEVEKQIRRIVDRAFRDLREDFESFGLSGD